MSEEYTVCEEPTEGQCVHVEGWNPACVFQYVGCEDGRSVLVTPKTRKIYKTANRLLHTRKNAPLPEGRK